MKRRKFKDVRLQNFISGCREDVDLQHVDLDWNADTQTLSLNLHQMEEAPEITARDFVAKQFDAVVQVCILTGIQNLILLSDDLVFPVGNPAEIYKSRQQYIAARKQQGMPIEPYLLEVPLAGNAIAALTRNLAKVGVQDVPAEMVYRYPRMIFRVRYAGSPLPGVELRDFGAKYLDIIAETALQCGELIKEVQFGIESDLDTIYYPPFNPAKYIEASCRYDARLAQIQEREHRRQDRPRRD